MTLRRLVRLETAGGCAGREVVFRCCPRMAQPGPPSASAAAQWHEGKARPKQRSGHGQPAIAGRRNTIPQITAQIPPLQCDPGRCHFTTKPALKSAIIRGNPVDLGDNVGDGFLTFRFITTL